MHRLSKRSFALLGGALLIALSVSTTLGANPADPDEPRGQTIAAFVHSLIFGEEEVPAHEPTDEVGKVEGTDASAHGACVSEVAGDKDAIGGPNDNHGGAVSEAARETCREQPVAEEELTDPEEPVVVETDTHGACVSAVARDKDAVGGPNDNHGGAVSEAARETCREGFANPGGAELGIEEVVEEPDAVVDAPRERGNSAFGQAGGNSNGDGQGSGNGNGGGNGGGGRP